MQSSQDHFASNKRIVSSRAISVTVLCAIVLAGACNIIYPFNGDQALFTIGAKCLANGGVLYRDFWDLKQPGIYWFYHLAGAICGYNEIGIHAFEAVWFCVLAIVISITTKKQFRIGWMSDICALLTVGVYFSVCGSWHLTQLEGLVSLPMFVCLWLVVVCNPTTRLALWKWLGFGLLVAVIGCFKLLLIVIPMSFLAIALVPQKGEKFAGTLRNIFISCALAAIGASLVLIPVICYFAGEHQLGLIYKTFFVYPPRMVAELPMNKVIVLLRSGRWFALAAAPLLPLAVIGLITRLGKRRDKFAVAIVIWICLASVLVLIQHMWWEYHFLLILFPLGILATMGLEDSILWFDARRRFAGCALMVLVITPYAFRTVRKALAEVRHPGLVNFRQHISPEYADAVVESQWLLANSHPDDEIYVLGNPLIYFLSNHAQGVPMNGWSPEFLLSDQWVELAGQIRSKHPPFVFISRDNDAIMKDRGKVVQELVRKEYPEVWANDVGIWYSTSVSN